MRRMFPVLVAILAGPAFAQQLAPQPAGAAVTTCGEFRKLDMAGRIAALTAIEPLGDEIDPEDRDAAKTWADQVAEACGDDAARPLAAAAEAALDQQ